MNQPLDSVDPAAMYAVGILAGAAFAAIYIVPALWYFGKKAWRLGRRLWSLARDILQSTDSEENEV